MATTQLHDLLADAGGVGTKTADRLVAHGFETAADLAEADHERLTDIPYVSDLRADELRSLADEEYTDPREVVLDAELGDRLSIDLAHRRGWKSPQYVIEVDEPTTWRDAAGGEWQTRRIRIADSPTADTRTEFDLVVGGDVYVTGGPAGDERWRVASVKHDGRVQHSTFVQLQAAQQDTGVDRPEGDDTWRRYQEGEA